MTRVMLDSTTPFQSIPPAWNGLIGTYCTGKYAVPLEQVQDAFPYAQGHIRINVDANPSYGNCLDIETGDATPADLDRWLHARLDQGMSPMDLAAYCNRNSLPGVLAATSLAIHHWVATLDGTLFIPGYTPLVGPAAVQVIGATKAGANVDVSIVLEDTWLAGG